MASVNATNPADSARDSIRIILNRITMQIWPPHKYFLLKDFVKAIFFL